MISFFYLPTYSKKWVLAASSNSLFILQDIYKSYRQVLTKIVNALLLLKQGILDKLRLAYIYRLQHKRVQYFNWFILEKRNGNCNELETQSNAGC